VTWDGPAAAAEVAARLERWGAVDALAASPLVRDHLVGQNPGWTALMRRAVEVARFGDCSMLVTGETGTGKELLARLIHTLDARDGKGELIVLDCTTVVPTLSGSEFFGHERGAFTGAVAARDGAFGMANGGTLFLDEIGELSVGLQSELLRVIQEGAYKRVGSDAWRRTSFRLICATNRDLLAAQEGGMFRRDLYYRLATWSCRMPALRERPDDIPLLARHFLAEIRRGVDLEFDDAVMEMLVDRDYPGNVRDLRQLIARIGQRHVGSGRITVGDVPPEDRPPVSQAVAVGWPGEDLERAIRPAVDRGVSLKQIGALAADAAVRIALASEGGNVRRAARRLSVTERALQLRRAKDRARSTGPSALIVVPDADAAG
jgi:transcriptional regulator with GAF, ATPase, and Fis domain